MNHAQLIGLREIAERIKAMAALRRMYDGDGTEACRRCGHAAARHHDYSAVPYLSRRGCFCCPCKAFVPKVGNDA